VAESLALQVTSPVLWEDTVRHMAGRGVSVFVEVGPGRTLASLIRRILPEAVVIGVSDTDSLRRATEKLHSYALEVVS